MKRKNKKASDQINKRFGRLLIKEIFRKENRTMSNWIENVIIERLK